MNRKCIGIVAVSVLVLPPLQAQNAKFGADSLKYSRDAYSKVHMVAIAKFSFEQGPDAEFKYDRYPNGGPERIQSGEGVDFARKDGKTWLVSENWGETGQPADAQTSKRLNNWLSVIDGLLNSQAPLKFIAKRDAGQRDEFVFEENPGSRGEHPRFVFSKYKNAKNDSPPILSEFSGPMKLGNHDANVDIKFSYLIAVKINDVTEVSPSPASSAFPSLSLKSENGNAVTLLDGKLKLDLPSDFSRDPDDSKDPKTLAKFSGPDGAWGAVLRGTHGLTPDKLEGYLNMRVAEYSKGFNWLPKDSHLQWLKKEIVTIDGRKWADWRYVPMLKGKKDYSHSPVYTRFLTTSYKGQLLEISFTSNLNTDPKLKTEIDQIMESVHLEE
jgi:hypothetical protein